MRIVHVVESLEVGGLEHMVVALAAVQRRAGHDVSITCLWRRGALAERAEHEGIPVRCCEKSPGLDVGALGRLRSELRRTAADVIHSHNPMAHYYAAVAAFGLGTKRLVNTRHGMGGEVASARGERLYRLSMRVTHRAASVCEAARRRFVARGTMPADKAVVVPNGIALDRFVPRDATQAHRLKAELGIDPRAIVFGSVGRLNAAKQQELLLAALRRVLDAGTPAALVIAGDGERRALLESERDRLGLADHVRLLGARGDVPALLAAMDVFVLSSRTEGYSLALVEASAAALPIVATAVGGNAEIVADEVTGLLVAPDDAPALAAAMLRLAGDAPLRERYGQAARRWALAHGSIDAMARAYAALYGDAGAGAHAALAA